MSLTEELSNLALPAASEVLWQHISDILLSPAVYTSNLSKVSHSHRLASPWLQDVAAPKVVVDVRAAKKAERVRPGHLTLECMPSDHPLLLAVNKTRLAAVLLSSTSQAAARGVKQVVVTQPEESDPLAGMYGDHALIQSSEVTNRKWTEVHTLTAASQGEKVRSCCPLGLGT